MKAKVFFFVIALVFTNFLFASDHFQEMTKDDESTDTLYVIGLGYNNSDRELLFTGNDIKYFNLSTREIIFDDSLYEKLEKRFFWYKSVDFFLNDETLFENVELLTSLDSRFVNDLVLFVKIIFYPEIRVYLYDGRPSEIPESWPEEIKEVYRKERETNAEKRKAEWDIFIKYLSDRGKIITSIEDVKTSHPIKIYSSEKTIHINNQTEKNVIVSVYRIDGVKVSEQTVTSQTTTIEIPVSGFYLVSVRTGNEKPVMEKVIIR